jgi:DNA-binding transcriptional LysR family regulator
MSFDLNEVSIFIKVVQTGSFTEAAKALGMPKSTVSGKISSLEKRLAVTLIQRTTRKLNVTSEGQAYFKHCVRGMEQIQSGEEELASGHGDPHGLLRITAPVELGTTVLPEIISQFSRKFPRVSVEVVLTDRTIDLLAENIDLAIRGGELEDSTLIAKKLGSDYFAPFASPKYLKMHGTPNHPKELKQHSCIQLTSFGWDQWSLTGTKGTSSFPVPTRLMANDMSMVKKFVLLGDGIALMPTFMVVEEVKSKKLVRILPDWTSGEAAVHFVYPAQRFVTAKLRAFIEFSTDPLQRNFRNFEI